MNSFVKRAFAVVLAAMMVLAVVGCEGEPLSTREKGTFVRTGSVPQPARSSEPPLGILWLVQRSAEFLAGDRLPGRQLSAERGTSPGQLKRN